MNDVATSLDYQLDTKFTGASFCGNKSGTIKVSFDVGSIGAVIKGILIAAVNKSKCE